MGVTVGSGSSRADEVDTARVPGLRGRVLLLTCAVGTSAATGVLALGPLPGRIPLVYLVSAVGLTVAYMVMGWLVSEHPRARRSGCYFLAAGATWPANWWGLGGVAEGPVLSLVASMAFWSLMVLSLFSYPADQPWTRTERRVIPLSLAWLNGGQLVFILLSRPEWNGFPVDAWWPSVAGSRSAFEGVAVAYGLGLLAVAGGVVTLLLRRLRGALVLDRRVLLPTTIGVSTAAFTGAAGSIAQSTAPSTDVFAAGLFVQGIGLLMLPASLLASVLRQRLTRGTIAELVVMQDGPVTIEGVRRALRTALGDESLEVLFWVAEQDGYVDGNGRPATALCEEQRLVVPVAASDGTPLVRIVADPRLAHHDALVSSAVGAARLALENVRLQAGLRARLEQVQASRARIVEVQHEERRRLERNLHDGAQQRLLAVSMSLGLARQMTSDEQMSAVVDEARAELRRALEDLRDLARGIHPAVLTQSGLCAAVESLVERRPMPVALRIPSRRWPAGCEATAYFVISEALANVTKHAAAASCEVQVEETSKGLEIRVRDDGPGGADGSSGSGITGLRDRLASVGGVLELHSPAGQGTVVRAVIPCV